MAKRRTSPPVNPLSVDLIAAAVAPVKQQEVIKNSGQDQLQEAHGFSRTPKKEAVPIPRRLPRAQKTLRVRFPDTEFEDNAALTKQMRGLMGGSKVTESDITRALWSLTRQAEAAMKEIAAKAPKVTRPSNGDWLAKAEYDDAVAHFLHLALKKMSAQDQ